MVLVRTAMLCVSLVGFVVGSALVATYADSHYQPSRLFWFDIGGKIAMGSAALLLLVGISALWTKLRGSNN